MRVLLALLVVLAIAQATDFEYTVDTQYGIYELNDGGNISDVVKCLGDSKREIQNLIDLSKAIGEQRYFDVARDVIKIINEALNVLTDCGSLFCYGPSYKKCEQENDTTCEMWGAIVYPDCKPGYTNWDCCVCATECPAGWRDDGLYCAKPAAYGRGAGYAIWDEDKCNNENPQGCEKWGAIWYPKCKEGFHNVACCVCSPDCPEGWEDIGVSCKKPSSYGRGVGYPVSFGLQCIFERQQEVVDKIATITEEMKPTTCAEDRSNLYNLSVDSQSKIDSTSGDLAQHLLPGQILDLIQETVFYVDLGCLEIDQGQQEQLY